MYKTDHEYISVESYSTIDLEIPRADAAVKADSNFLYVFGGRNTSTLMVNKLEVF